MISVRHKWLWWLLLAVCLTGAPDRARAGYVHASGTSLVDSSGQPFLPRGVNLGSWLWPELWMMGGPNLSAYAGVDDFATLNAAVLDAVGGDTNLQAQALGAMRSNFVSSADVVLLHSNGFNSVRVPFHYQLFFQITNAANNYPTNGYDINTGFIYLDNLAGWCATNDIYVIPDMHGVPGGKDYLVAGNVYTNTSNHALFLHVWSRIAAHYATNQWIGGYDLINEPVNNAGGYQLIPGTLLSTTFADPWTPTTCSFAKGIIGAPRCRPSTPRAGWMPMSAILIIITAIHCPFRPATASTAPVSKCRSGVGSSAIIPPIGSTAWRANSCRPIRLPSIIRRFPFKRAFVTGRTRHRNSMCRWKTR